MSARVYAEKNAGKRIRIYESSAGPNKRLIKYPYCRVVGYNFNDDGYIFVEFEDKPLHQYCFNPVGNPSFIRTAPALVPVVWQIGYESVRFLRRSKTTITKPANPYPHTCKKCHSPSRNCSNYVLCSNGKCSSKKKFKKIVLAGVAKTSRIKCPTCKGNAIEVGASRNKANVPEWRFSCVKKHVWIYSPKENDLVSSSHRSGEKDRIWKINGWQIH